MINELAVKTKSNDITAVQKEICSRAGTDPGFPSNGVG